MIPTEQNSLGVTETSQISTPFPSSCLAPEVMRGNFGWMELGKGQEEEEAAAALGCALPAALSPDVPMSWGITNPKSWAVPLHGALPLSKLLHREELGWHSTTEFHTGSIPSSSRGVNTTDPEETQE